MPPWSKIILTPRLGPVPSTAITTPGRKRRWWQRPRWLAVPQLGSLSLVMAGWRIDLPVEIVAEPDVPGGAYYRRDPAKHVIGVDPGLSAVELSKALYHELRHAMQSERFFRTPSAYYAVTSWATVEGDRSGLGSWWEEDARGAEENHYYRPLARMEKV